MKNVLKIALLVLAVGLSYLVYNSVQGLVRFNEEKLVRYADVVTQLEDVANAERLYKGYHGEYTDNLDSLKNYINNGKILLINRKDTTKQVYDAKRRIEVMKSFTVVDTVYSSTSVKDSLFKKKSLNDFGFVNINGKKEPIKLYASFNDRIIGEDSTNIQRDHFFKATVDKRKALAGLGDDYIDREMNDETSPISEEVIQVGSDRRPTLEGNWSSEIDAVLKERKIKAQNANLKK